MDYLIVILKYFLIFFFVVNIAITYSLIFNKKIEETIIFSVANKIILMFIFGIFGSFLIGFYLDIIINVVFLFFNIFYFLKNKIYFKNNVITVGFLVFIFMFLYFILLTHNRATSTWDEFSHWALATKNMFNLNNFGLNSSVPAVISYLTGTGMYQYFNLKLFGSFNEGIMIFSMCILTYSFILPITKIFKSYKQIMAYPICLILLFVPTIIFKDIYTALYVDGILGLAFGYSMYSYYLLRKDLDDKFKIINLFYSFMMLIFIKDMGLVLALFILILILIDNLFVNSKFKFKIKYVIDKTKWIILSFLPALLTRIIWQRIILNYNVTSNIQAVSIFGKIKSFFAFNFSETDFQISQNYFEALFNRSILNIIIDISFVFFILLFCLILILLLIKNTNKHSLRLGIWCSCIFCFSLGYSFVMLISYLYVFGGYEGLNLASFNRYLGTFVLGLFIFLIVVLFEEFLIINNKKRKYVFLSIFIFLVLISNKDTLLNYSIYIPYSKISGKSNREGYNMLLKPVFENCNENDKINYISIANGGMDYWVSRYLLSPITINYTGIGWSIGNPYYEGDIWSQYYDLKNYKNILSKYDYVFIYQINDEYLKNYGELFNQKASDVNRGQLYKVDSNSSTKYILELVE